MAKMLHFCNNRKFGGYQKLMNASLNYFYYSVDLHVRYCAVSFYHRLHQNVAHETRMGIVVRLWLYAERKHTACEFLYTIK
jgi:hypothetical protein